MQAGLQGLHTALDKYDPSRGTRLSTMATWWVSTQVRRAHAREMRVIHVPENVEHQMRHVYLAQQLTWKQLHRWEIPPL